MSEVVFNDKNTMPDNDLLIQKLGDTYLYWLEIKKHVNELVGDTTDEWKYYGKKYGWQLKTLLKKRNLFFLIPDDSFFKIVLIFGDKAVQKIEQSDISIEIKNDIINAKKYMEGRGVAIEVKDGKYLADIRALIDIKINS